MGIDFDGLRAKLYAGFAILNTEAPMLGQNVAHYQITSQLGRGGMGVVYQATDKKLGRQVAIKILPKEYAIEPERLLRFQQEVKLLSALNHPNIMTVFDAGQSDGISYFVGELLLGKTLREMLRAGALPPRKAIKFAIQMAHGLSAAHESGITHRDLKPENIMITNDEQIKILDFGVAKLTEVQPPSPGDVDSSRSGITIRSTSESLFTTEPGRVIGTPHYMSPEQVRGESTDYRSDIFAYGVILSEILTGQNAFRRETPIESMNAILSDELPEFQGKLGRIPIAITRVVQRCLEKNPQRRFQSSTDLAFAVENARFPSDDIQTAARTPREPWSLIKDFLPWGISATCLVGFVLMLLFRANHTLPSSPPPTRAASVRQFELSLPMPAEGTENQGFIHPAIAPSGDKLVYANLEGLWLHRLDRITAPVLLAQVQGITDPFWSPEGTDIGFFAGRKLYRVSAAGGNPIPIASLLDNAHRGVAGGAWMDGRIVFTSGTGDDGLLAVPSQGGKAETIHALAEEEGDFHNASALPEDQGILFVVHRHVGFDTIAVLSPEGERTILLQLPGNDLYRPVYASTGHIVFQRESDARGIWAFSFSLRELKRTGEPFRVSDVGRDPSVSRDGTLVFGLQVSDYLARKQLTWVDRSGKMGRSLGTALPGLSFHQLSPDNSQVVAISGESVDSLDLWRIDVVTGGAIPFTLNREWEEGPQWVDDGDAIVFTRRIGPEFKVIKKSTKGAIDEETLFEGMGKISGSGKYLLVFEQAANASRKLLGYKTLYDGPNAVHELSQVFQSILAPELSPTDRFLVYSSEETGQSEVYIVNFPEFTNKRVISRGGGHTPRWNAGGTELYFLSLNGRKMMCFEFSAEGNKAGEPFELFTLPDAIHGDYTWWDNFYDVDRGGERFLMLRKDLGLEEEKQATQKHLRVVVNWHEEFDRSQGAVRE